MALQRFSDETVLDAARRRIAFIFDSFQHIQVSVSGGKDSSVLAHLALSEARRRDRRIGLFFLDEEVMYQSTVDQVEHLMSLYPENTNRLWLQIPFHLTNATSLTEPNLIAWQPGKHKIWMRSKGKENIGAPPWKKEDEVWIAGRKYLDFYGVIQNWERCHKGTAFLVGLRGLESPNRWRAMQKNPATVAGRKVYWATAKEQNTALYPIHDWTHEDIWRYHHDQSLRYSKIYDMQLKKGFSFTQMRISSLIHERSFKSLCELPEFEPHTYDKLCKRVKGIEFAQETGRNRKMFAARTLPKNYQSWLTYRDFLLSTYPDAVAKNVFARRFGKQLQNEFVARQQCRQLICNDIENNLAVKNEEDPRDQLIGYYREVL